MRRRALIFEDEPVLRQMLWTVFDGRGYETFSYPDPGLCPLHAEDRCPCPDGMICADVVVTDIHMDSVNGMEFLDHLFRMKCRKPEIAVMSGTFTDEEKARAAAIGCRLFEKPFHFEAFTRWLDQVESKIPADRKLFDWNLGCGWGREP